MSPDARAICLAILTQNNSTEWADEHCASCGQPHAWHGRDEKDRVCPECRFADAEDR